MCNMCSSLPWELLPQFWSEIPAVRVEFFIWLLCHSHCTCALGHQQQNEWDQTSRCTRLFFIFRSFLLRSLVVYCTSKNTPPSPGAKKDFLWRYSSVPAPEIVQTSPVAVYIMFGTRDPKCWHRSSASDWNQSSGYHTRKTQSWQRAEA